MTMAVNKFNLNTWCRQFTSSAMVEVAGLAWQFLSINPIPMPGAGNTPLLRWWRPRVFRPNPDGSTGNVYLTSKAPLKQRKVVNTVRPDGRIVGVNAQQYAVLVTSISKTVPETK